jgi:CBS domain-containing protein
MDTPSEADTVNDVMTRWVLTVAPSDSLLKARDSMIQNHTSQLVVVDSRGRSIGLISKRGIARFLLDDSSDRSFNEIIVSEAATKALSTIRRDLAIVNAARLFDTGNLTYAVVSNEEPLVGIITETDLCHYFSQRAPGRFKVLDFMQRDFIFAKSTYPLVHVAHAVIFRQPSVPVIDEELVGIITLSDILSTKERLPKVGTFKSLDNQNAALIMTRDVMTVNPITTTENSDLAQAAQNIVTKGISSLPVVDDNSQVVGLLSKHDVVKALGQFSGKLMVEAKHP